WAYGQRLVGLFVVLPASARGLFGYALPLDWREFLRSCFSALQPADASVFLSRFKRIVLDFARGDLHHADGVANHVCGSAFASRSSGHVARIARLNRDAKRIEFQTETLPRASFVPSKVISAGSRPRPISGEPGEHGTSWRLTIAYA